MQDNRPGSRSGGESGSYDEFDDFLNVDDTESEDPPSPSNRDRAQGSRYRPPYEKSSRRPAGERETAFNALAWLIEGATGIVEELRHNDLGLSEDFWVHASAARREGLLAARAILDQLLDETEQQQEAERQRQDRQTRRGNINVDF